MIKNIMQKFVCRISILHIFCAFCAEMRAGYGTYRQIKRKMGNVTIYLQYYQGTGDVYLSAAYLKQCENKRNILGRSVFVVNGTNAYRVAALMGIESIPIIAISEKKAYSLVRLTRFIGTEGLDIKYLHYISDYPMYTAFLITLAGLNGIGFMDLYRDTVFEGEQLKLPTPRWVKNETLTASKTSRERKILLAPVANSIAEGPDILFWRELARRLNQTGYKVYTNVTNDEKPIAGTEPVFIPYKELGSFLDDRAVFIGYRSGLCDLIASLNCKKIILYPKTAWPIVNGLDISSTLDIFSLNKMGICNDAVELEYNMEDVGSTLSEIIRELTEC